MNNSEIYQSSTRSPDGSWCLDLKLVQHSTLFHSRKVLDSRIKHITNPDWNVGASIPLNDADAKTISNEHPEHPIVWSKDTCKVSYWINEQMEDSIEIETEGGQFRYQRDLYDTSVTYTDKQNAK